MRRRDRSGCMRLPRGRARGFPLDVALPALGAESYIGATLRSAAGEPIGLIAVISRRPIVDVRMAESILRVVAVRAEGELEREQAVRRLSDSETRWRFALEGAGDALWDWDVPAGTVFFSKRHKQLLGYAEDELGDVFEEWRSRVHPED